VEQEKLRLLYPVRALEIYVRKTSQCRKYDQLFVYLRPLGYEGLPGY